MQAKVDVGQLMVQYGARVHQVPHKCLSAQAEAAGEAGRSGRFRPVKSSPPAPVPEVQRAWLLLPKDPIGTRFPF